MRDTPMMRRAIATAVRTAWRSRGASGAATPRPTQPLPAPGGADEPITLPMATVFVDADEWEARAQSLGGTSSALLAGVAARLAQRMGRVTADGSVAVSIAVDERTAGDTRGNAATEFDITANPASAPSDLREIRGAIKQALIRHRHRVLPDEARTMMSIAPLMSLVPKRFARPAGNATRVVSSALGVVNPAMARPDGTDADYVGGRLLYPGVTKAMIDQFGGLQMVLSGKVLQRVFVSVTAYQPGRLNTNDILRQDLSSVLSEDFALIGTHL
jgi:diacylglycerol O-acyltransferase / wax synthase